ncbi:MAG TPA: hypothetical protein VF026_01795 [Ktedonobacteraceae bacterium]
MKAVEDQPHQEKSAPLIYRLHRWFFAASIVLGMVATLVLVATSPQYYSLQNGVAVMVATRHIRNCKHRSDSGPSSLRGARRVSAACELAGDGMARDAPFSLVGQYRYAYRVHQHIPCGSLFRPGCSYL